MVASHTKVVFRQSTSDMCMSFGKHRANTILMFIDQVSLVASPALLETLSNSEDLDALVKLPKITIDWGHENRDLADWDNWLKAANLTPAPDVSSPHFNL